MILFSFSNGIKSTEKASFSGGTLKYNIYRSKWLETKNSYFKQKLIKFNY